MTRKRYFPRQVVKPAFSWVGQTVPPPPQQRKLGHLSHYNAFKLGDLTAGCGDYVLVKNDGSDDDLLTYDVAKIESMYENTANKDDSHRAIVTWLCRPSLLPKQLKGGHGHEEQGAPPLEEHADVLLEARNFDPDISLESVYYKCVVIPIDYTENPSQLIKDYKESNPGLKFPVYALRFKMKNCATKGRASKSSTKFVIEPYEPSSNAPKEHNRSREPLGVRAGYCETPPELRKHLFRDPSPELPLQPKLEIPLTVLNVTSRKRPLSGDRSNGGPSKRTKASFSAANTPDKGGRVNSSDVETGKRTPKPNPKYLKDAVASPKTPKSPHTPKVSGGGGPTSLNGGPTGLNGGYWGDVGSPKRTPKPNSKLFNDDNEEKRSQPNSASKLTPRRAGENKSANKQKMGSTPSKAGSQSGKKVDKTQPKKFAKSSGLGNKEIISMLDSDEDDEEPEPPRKGSAKKAASKSVRATPKSTRPTPVKQDKKKPPSATKKAEPKSRVSKVTESASKRRSTTLTKAKPTPQKKKKPLEASSDEDDFDPSEQSSESGSDSDDDDFQKKRPPTGKKTQKTSSSQPSTAAKRALSKIKTFTPGVAARKAPLPSNLSPLEEAQARLHVSAVPDSLPCREDEFTEIFGYVESKLQEGTGGCIYISGVPGTGKTATVKQVMRYMMENPEDFPEFQFHEVNGMRLTCPEQTYVEMWKLLTGEKLVHEQAMKKLDSRFSTPAPKRTHTVFLVDELDMLCKKKQTVLYNMFEWPSRPPSKLIIIAIANTMDLPERDMDMRVISRLGLNRLHFEPYTQQQLQCIVSSRLEGLSVFPPDELQLVSRKVASLSGDARRALDICRMVAQRCEREGRERVNQMDVLAVHKEMYTSPKIMYIRTCSTMEQFFLRALVSEFHRTGVEETTLRSAHGRFNEILSAENVAHPSLYSIIALAARLSSQRLILSEDYRKGLDTKLRLNVGFEDVNFALMPRPVD